MAATRKLQGEIDRCLKKVTEGVETFEDIWQKVHNATNSNQKEKYEADLKKEIKKLQRLRDQIKSWITSAEIKDKTSLLEYRKLIETQMERFKVVERETKTKAYSKEGLGATQKLDPAQKERDEMREWLVTSIDALNIQVDQFESEVEGLVIGKKKKLDKEKQDRMDELRVKLEKHRYHIRKLETILRMLHNMSVEVDKLKDIKDDVEYYIDSSEEPDFKENEFLYDDIIGLEEVELSAGLSGENEAGDTPTSTVSDVTPPPDPPSPSLNHSSDSRNQDPLPAKVVKPTAVRAVAGNNGTNSMSKPVQTSTPMKVITTPNNSSPSSGLNHVVAGGNFAAIAAAPTAVNPTAKPTVSHSVENGCSALSNAHGSQIPISGALSSISGVTSIISEPHNLINNSNSGTGGTTSSMVNNIPSSAASSSGADSSRASPMASPSPPTHKPTLLHNGPIPKLIDQMSSLKMMAQQVVEKSGQMDMRSNQNQVVLDLEPAPAQETSVAVIPPILGVAPLGSAPLTKEQQFQLNMLDVASFHMPLPADSIRPNAFLPINPVTTPQYYIQTYLPGFDTIEFHQRLSPETLFFMFYYMQGSKAQYISAKALKKQSWRFHTKYMMWFQRHEEPKVINEDYEQGTYIYFDFEKWAQKKKEGFTFEYKYLEDKDLN